MASFFGENTQNLNPKPTIALIGRLKPEPQTDMFILVSPTVKIIEIDVQKVANSYPEPHYVRWIKGAQTGFNLEIKGIPSPYEIFELDKKELIKKHAP